MNESERASVWERQTEKEQKGEVQTEHACVLKLLTHRSEKPPVMPIPTHKTISGTHHSKCDRCTVFLDLRPLRSQQEGVSASNICKTLQIMDAS